MYLLTAACMTGLPNLAQQVPDPMWPEWGGESGRRVRELEEGAPQAAYLVVLGLCRSRRNLTSADAAAERERGGKWCQPRWYRARPGMQQRRRGSTEQLTYGWRRYIDGVLMAWTVCWRQIESACSLFPGFVWWWRRKERKSDRPRRKQNNPELWCGGRGSWKRGAMYLVWQL